MAWQVSYRDEFARRLKNRNALMGDELKQRQLNAYYSKNCIAWINDWAVTFDPRAKPPMPSLMPFLLFPRQEEMVKFILGCLEDKESGLIEKSRDMGATWLCCAITVWLWLYRPGTVIGWGSLKADQVDKPYDPKAIFPKIRQIMEHLPPWMMPAGFRMSVHSTHMKIINPVNGNVIAGESGDNMGRGGRTSIYFKDESAHYEHAEQIEAALGDNTDVQIDMSSVNGTANPFYRRRKAGEVWYPDTALTPGKVRVFILDWRQNPLKSQEWYDRRRAKAMAEGMMHVLAQEVDRDYSGAVDRLIIHPDWIRAAVDAHIKLNFAEDGEVIAGQDIADGGKDKNALAVVVGVILRYADHWGGDAGEAPRSVTIPECIRWRVKLLSYDMVGVGSGFKTGINILRERGLLPKRLRVMPWNGGAGVLDPDEHITPGDPETPTNDEFYENLKAQGYWRLRTRFYKTWRAVEFGDSYPEHELISLDSRIPRLEEVKMELAQPVHKYSKKGKTMVDKTPDGSTSPNLADAVNIAYNPVRELSILDVL